MIVHIIKERNNRIIFKYLFTFFVNFLCFLTFHVSYGLSQTEQNSVHTGISHTYWYSDPSDLIMDIPHQMDNTWFFAVINLPDVGADVVVTKITANTFLPIIWHDTPSYQSPPNFEWDLNVTIPEGYVDAVNGHIMPDISLPPFVMYSRMVDPAILSGSESFQED